MDTISMEASGTTKSTEFLTKSQRKNRRRKAKTRERKKRTDQELKILEAPRNEESSVEEMASLKKSELDVDSTAQSVKGLPKKSTIGKRWVERKRGKALNSNAEVNTDAEVKKHDSDSVQAKRDNVKGTNDKTEGQLLPLGHPGVEKDSVKGLLEKNTVGERRWMKRRSGKVLNNNVDPSSMDQNDNLSKPGLSDNKLGEVENVSLNPNILARDSGSSVRKATETLCMADVGISLSVPSSDLVNELEEPEQLNHGNVALPPTVQSVKGLPRKSTFGKRWTERTRGEALNNNAEVNTIADVNKHDSNAVQAKRDNVKGTNDKTKGQVSLFEAGRDSAKGTNDKTEGQVSLFEAGRDSVKGSNDNVGSASLSAGICLRRKLLILDVNGLLADIVHPPPKDCKPDECFYRRAIFERPYYYAFLKFCFNRFDVAIWSSRSKKIIVKVVDYLLGDLKHKLLFCWDMSHSTQTKFKTLDNKYKPLVCKELSKVWDRYDPSLPWERGDYDESNTLLLDDSPYKALLNPAHTAIFPPTYNYKVENDNSLGLGGDLRIYLEEILKAEHVQKYVEQHPFGQQAIDETSSDWKFYSNVLGSLRGQSVKQRS